MSTPNQSGQTPNAAQNTPQSTPANTSAAGNTPSGVSGAGDATQGTHANGSTSGGNAGGTPNAPNPVTFSPEQNAEIERRVNAAAAAARRQTEADNERERERRDAEARGDVQGLLDTERREHGETRRQLADMTRQHNALIAALDEGLPNPTAVAPRLRGNTLEELRADARQFATLLGTALPRPAEPPATPQGGGAPAPPATTGGNGDGSQTPAPANRANVTDADLSAEMRSGAYGSLG